MWDIKCCSHEYCSSDVFSFFPFQVHGKIVFPWPHNNRCGHAIGLDIWAEGMCVILGGSFKNQYTSYHIPFSVLWLSWKQVRHWDKISMRSTHAEHVVWCEQKKKKRKYSWKALIWGLFIITELHSLSWHIIPIHIKMTKDRIIMNL